MTETKTMELLKSEVPQLTALLRLNAIDGVDVQTIVLQELEYLRMASLTNPAIMECMPQTAVMAIKTVLKQNLSLDPAAGLVNIKTRNIKIKGANGEDVWKKALEITPTYNGLISINRQCGRILDIKNPVVKKDNSGKVIEVSVEILLPSTPSHRWEVRTFDESDFYRWRRSSHKENGRNKQDADAEKLNYANENYTNWKGGIDPEFARAKAVRHGLKKLGANQNEGRVVNITIPSTKNVIIDSEKDQEATGDEGQTHYAEVVESTTNEPAIKPNQDFTGKL